MQKSKMRIAIDIDLNEEATAVLMKYVDSAVKKTLQYNRWETSYEIKVYKEIGSVTSKAVKIDVL
jgi:hypothetical protein